MFASTAPAVSILCKWRVLGRYFPKHPGPYGVPKKEDRLAPRCTISHECEILHPRILLPSHAWWRTSRLAVGSVPLLWLCSGAAEKAVWSSLVRLQPVICARGRVAFLSSALVRNALFVISVVANTRRVSKRKEMHTDAMHQLPNQSGGEMDSETFLLMGFMVLPMLFIMFGLMQRMQSRRRELPAPPVTNLWELVLHHLK